MLVQTQYKQCKGADGARVGLSGVQNFRRKTCGKRTLCIFAYVHILDLIAFKSIFNEEFKYVIYIVLRPPVE
jgi:hypothetical protein